MDFFSFSGVSLQNTAVYKKKKNHRKGQLGISGFKIVRVLSTLVYKYYEIAWHLPIFHFLY